LNLSSHDFLSTFEFNPGKIIPIHKCKKEDFATFNKVEGLSEDEMNEKFLQMYCVNEPKDLVFFGGADSPV